MPPKPIVFPSQIELPVDAEDVKSPIRKRELDLHHDSELHILNNGLPNQMLVMTATGPKMMTPVIRCSGVDALRYSCVCRMEFGDTPQAGVADFEILCYRMGFLPVPDNGTLNHPDFTLEFESLTMFFRFVPVKVYDSDLSQLQWGIIDNTASTLHGSQRLIDGKMVFDLLTEGGKWKDDWIAVGQAGKQMGTIGIHLVYV